MAVQIGKYGRPGVFIEEYDKSIITNSVVDEGITNLVIGVSKKGPINTPIRVTTEQEFINTFGDIDRNLERKGSFFHRTVLKMLKSAPVYAVNLLKTDDNLDKIDFTSLSASVKTLNGGIEKGSYRKFFNTTGFWTKDTDSFLNLVKKSANYDAGRVFNLANMSDKPITVFAVKSKVKGYDRTLLNWYGSTDKVPAYVDPNDYASDYLIDVVVVGGDWSDYKTLAIDKHWGQYFTTSGLIKGKLRDFANDSLVNLISYYEPLSLIPNFRDTNGRNIFVGSVINADTNQTGLFCSYDEDAVEAEFYNGLIDIIGQTVAEDDNSEINFLSYKDNIAETITYKNTPLDLPGNVLALTTNDPAETHAYSGKTVGDDDPRPTGIIELTNSTDVLSRTYWFNEGYVYDVTAHSATTNDNQLDTSDIKPLKDIPDDTENLERDVYYLQGTVENATSITKYNLSDVGAITPGKIYVNNINEQMYILDYVEENNSGSGTADILNKVTYKTAKIDNINFDGIITKLVRDTSDRESIMSFTLIDSTNPTGITVSTVDMKDDLLNENKQYIIIDNNVFIGIFEDYGAVVKLSKGTTLTKGYYVLVNNQLYVIKTNNVSKLNDNTNKVYFIHITTDGSETKYYYKRNTTNNFSVVDSNDVTSTDKIIKTVTNISSVDNFLRIENLNKYLYIDQSINGSEYEVGHLYKIVQEQANPTILFDYNNTIYQFPNYQTTLGGGGQTTITNTVATGIKLKYNNYMSYEIGDNSYAVINGKYVEVKKPSEIVYEGDFNYNQISTTLDEDDDETSANGVISFTTSVSVESDTYDRFDLVNDRYLFVLEGNDYSKSTRTNYYGNAYCLTPNGEIIEVKGTRAATSISDIVYPQVDSSYIVLNYVSFAVTNQQISDVTYYDATLYNGDENNIYGGGYNHVGLNTLDGGYKSSYEDGILTVVFNDTAKKVATNDYIRYRKIKMFNMLVSKLSSADKRKMLLLCVEKDSNGNIVSYTKKSLENAEIYDIVTKTSENKSFKLRLNLDKSIIPYDNLVFYVADNEFFIGRTEIRSKESQANAIIGIAGIYSAMYQDYYDGVINNGDFFYLNKLSEPLVSVRLVHYDEGKSYDGDYLVFEKESTSDIYPEFSVGDKLIIPYGDIKHNTYTIIYNDGIYKNKPNALANQILNEVNNDNIFAYLISEIVENDVIYDVEDIYLDNSEYRFIINAYLDSRDNLVMTYNDIDYGIGGGSNAITVHSAKSNYKQTVEILDNDVEDYEQQPNRILISTERYGEIQEGDYLLADYDPAELEEGQEPRRMTRILKKRMYADNPEYTELTCDAAIKKTKNNGVYQTMRYTTIDDYVTTYKAIPLGGFKLRQESLPDGTEERQNSILNMVAKGTNLAKALCNLDQIDFMYLVDSFGLGLAENSKQQLVDLCGERAECFGFINMPSMKSFRNSGSPSFVDEDGAINTEYIAKGADPKSSPRFVYSFAEGKGVTFAGYFMPYVNINDNGREISVPCAAWVATTYMNKHTSTLDGIVPWTICAGYRNGQVTDILSTEQVFTNDDIVNLNQARMNPIVYKRNRGYMIETENTAQTNYLSSLSWIHCREVLNNLSRDLRQMLLEYQWTFNTAQTRAEILAKANSICTQYVNRNGLYDFFCKMDSENNTPEIIDNQMGVLDVYIEIVKGLEKIVNNITILRTGAIQSGGFISA